MEQEQTMENLATLPNIGDALANKLASAGFTCYDDLASHGSVEVALRIRAGVDPGACYNMLYAIEGAIRGVRWHTMSKEERNQLKKEFDQAAGH